MANILKNLIVLPDGTELFSGHDLECAIKSVSTTDCVNSDTELTLGSVCASKLKATIQTPHGGLTISEGTEITFYKVDASGTRQKVGLFTLEKPVRPSANTYRITAYDRISWLDRDLSAWLNALEGWPYTVSTFAGMVCEQCGLTLAQTAWLNGDYEIQKFTANGITGRQLMKWVGEIEAKFVRATPDGEIELAWYTANADVGIGPSAAENQYGGTVTDDGQGNVTVEYDDMEVTDDGEGNVAVKSGTMRVSDDGAGNVVVWFGVANRVPYMSGGLSYEDYQVHPIERVRIQMTEDDVGVVYPTEGEGLNTYAITGNYLLTATESAPLEPVAQNIYEALQGATYTPCRVKIWANTNIRAGDILTVTDANGVTFTTWVMSKTQNGQSETLECTGSPRRDSPEVLNNMTIGQMRAKLLEIRKSIEGLLVKAISIENDLKEVTEVQIGADGILTEVSEELDGVEQRVSTLEQTAEGFETEVKDAEDRISSLEQTVEGFEFEVKDAEGNSCTLVLKSGSAELAAAAIKLAGVVTFEALSEAGATTINGANLSTGEIEAEKVGVTGKFVVCTKDGEDLIQGGHMGYMAGATEDGTTNGIGVSNVAGDVYSIATDEGIRLQAGNYYLWLNREGKAATNANLTVKGNLTVEGTLTY